MVSADTKYDLLNNETYARPDHAGRGPDYSTSQGLSRVMAIHRVECIQAKSNWYISPTTQFNHVVIPSILNDIRARY